MSAAAVTTPASAPARAQSFACIEGLRAWMAWWVVIAHAIQLCGLPVTLPAPLMKVILMGDVAVNVFIVVSGFVITHLLLSTQVSYRTYLARRALRIVPIYLLCTLVAVLTASWYRAVFVDLPWDLTREMRLDRIESTARHWEAHVVAHLTLLHGVIPESVLRYASSSLLAPAWSLSLEWQFYLVAPLVVAALGRRSPRRMLSFALMLLGGLVAVQLWRTSYQYPSMLLLSGHYFLLGIVSRLVIDEMPRSQLSAGVAWLLVLALALLSRSFELLVWGLFYVVALAEAGRIRPPAALLQPLVLLIATNRWIRRLGQVSYSTYLIHIPLFAAAGFAWQQGPGVATRADLQGAVLLALLVLPALSYLLYRWVEQPFIAMGRKARPQPMPEVRERPA